MTVQHRLPSLLALRAFEAASRSGNFTRAGEALLLTQSAVSRHIRNLEADLGVRLFERRGREMALTADGERLKGVVSDAFARLHDGVDQLRAQHAHPKLTVSLLPSLAAKWLAPKIGAFAAQHPTIELNIQCARALVDFEREGVDLAIRYGEGHWPGCTSELLMKEDILAVCAPAWLEKLGPNPSPSVLTQMTLLHGDSPDGWSDYFDAAGLSQGAPYAGPLISDDNALQQAAIDGHGFMLGRSVLIAEDLHSGRLVSPFRLRFPASFSYYIVMSDRVTPKPHVDAIRRFLLSEASH